MKKLTIATIIFLMLTVTGCYNKNFIEHKRMIDSMQNAISATNSLVAATENEKYILLDEEFNEIIIDFELTDQNLIQSAAAQNPFQTCYIRDKYIDVLQSIIGFYEIRIIYGYNDPIIEYRKLEDSLGFSDLDNIIFELTQFILVNVHYSDVPAVVLEFAPGGCRLVLHYNNGAVYGLFTPLRGMREITTEGIFDGSGGAAFLTIMKLQLASNFIEIAVIGYSDLLRNDAGEVPAYFIFGKEVSFEEWQKFLDKIYESEIALWYIFSAETIADDFALAWSKVFS